MSDRTKIFFTTLILALALPVTISVGAPGFNFDTTPPTIGTPTVTSITQGTSITVTAIVQDPDSQVKNVSIFYTTDHWSSVNKTVVMSYDNNTKIATGILPSPSIGVKLEYYITAFDPSGNRGVNNNNGSYYSYTGSPPSTLTTWTLAATAAGIAAAALGLTIFLYRKRKAESGPFKAEGSQDVSHASIV